MSFVVIDMEWNQAMRSDSPVFYRLPIHLRGEIIQIGAVKLNDDGTPGEEFQIDVKPVYFRKMHYKVEKLTGIDSARLNNAPGFKEAFEALRKFAGEDCTFLTWGYDDRGIMEQNIIIHDLEWDWIADWVNLQIIYNIQTDGEKNQRSLASAMEHFQIEQTRVAHDALGDAYNTALVCSHLNLREGLRAYDVAIHELETHRKKAEDDSQTPPPVAHHTFDGFDTREEAFRSDVLQEMMCPSCKCGMSLTRWVSQGDRRYMALASCAEHGKYLVRARLREKEDETWVVNRTLYDADDEMLDYYKKKLQASRRRRKKKRSE
ncbi:MAG: exonuclease domain-containing protein [Oscillospiraceae bacterium]|nr:exonuclease domain-containing protein [Oscillospiraceae bacterium]